MIEVSGIVKHYKKKLILDDLSFSVSEGECVGILGANGCGKSTLLSILAGALKADCGKIQYNKEDVTSDSSVFHKYVGYVPQENPLIEELSVKDNLDLWYTCAGKRLEDDLEKGLLKTMGLDSVLGVAAGKLSGGMKKRLSIACALCSEQPVLIMDEPSAALDLICKADIYQYMKSYLEQGGTILITTHDLTELNLCSRLYILLDGKLQEAPKGLSQMELVKRFVTVNESADDKMA